MNEVWKTITIDDNLYYSLYDVSNLGKIRSWQNNRWGKRKTPKIFNPSVAGNGYRIAGLCKNGIRKPFCMHTLIAHEFIGPRPKGLHINHKDGDKLNNNANNLEYCTPFENSLHAIKFGLLNNAGEKHGNSKLTEKDVLRIRQMYHSGDFSQKQLGEKYFVRCNTINRIVNNKRWRHI